MAAAAEQADGTAGADVADAHSSSTAATLTWLHTFQPEAKLLGQLVRVRSKVAESTGQGVFAGTGWQRPARAADNAAGMPGCCERPASQKHAEPVTNMVTGFDMCCVSRWRSINASASRPGKSPTALS